MIVGESEILGQVRNAWQAAVHEQTSSQLLSRLFKHAVESGKRVRTETGVSRHPVSIPSAAVAVAAEHLGSLDDARVLVVGAGQMGRGLAATLRDRGVARSAIANRTPARWRRAGRRVGGEAIPLNEIADALVDVDVLLTSTASSEVLVERATVEMVMACRDGRPLLVVDVALPRDVDPGVGDVPRRHAARPRRPEGLRGAVGRTAPRARSARSARSSRPRSSATAPSAPRVRSRRSSPRCASMGEDVRRHEIDRFTRQGRRALDPDTRELGRSVDAGHREQVAARADGACEGRGRNAARGDYYRRRARHAVRSPDRSDRSPSPSDRASRRAAARSRAGKPNASDRCSATTSSTCSSPRAATATRRPTLHAIGGQGVFMKEVQQAVLDERADVAVHSAKDLPSVTPPGLVLAAVPERGDARDALVGIDAGRAPDRCGRRDGLGAPARAARRGAARPHVRTVARQHRDAPAQARRTGLRRGRGRCTPRCERLGLADEATDVLEPSRDAAAGRARRARGRVPRRRRRHGDAVARDRRRGRAPTRRCGAGVPHRARRRVRPPVRRARERCRRRRSVTLDALLATTRRQCRRCGRRSRGADAERGAVSQPRREVLAALRSGGIARDRLARRRGPRRSRFVDPARRGAAPRPPMSWCTTGSRHRAA